MGNSGWVLWVVLMIALSVIEAATVNLVSVWFVTGALGAFLAALLGAKFTTQLVVFFVISGVLLVALRPFVKKYVTPKRTATNADMALNRETYVIEPIDNLRASGSVKLDGKIWTARSLDGSILPAGTLVRVVKLEGVKLYVEQAPVPAGASGREES